MRSAPKFGEACALLKSCIVKVSVSELDRSRWYKE